MVRLRLALMIVLFIAGCTGAPVTPTEPTNPPAITEPTLAKFTPTEEAATQAPSVESTSPASDLPQVQEYDVPAGTHPHDVAPAPDGSVWYTAQISGALGKLDPVTGETRHIPLGSGSAPHGVIVGPDDAPWVTDSGLNAIVRVDPATEEVQAFPLPTESGYTNLNTAAFDPNGILWFTGQNGIYGRLDPSTGEMQVFDAPRGRGPYGITVTPDGTVYYASLANSYVGHIDPQTGEATVLEPPTSNQGASGPIRRDGSGSANGTPGRSPCMILQMIRGGNGNYRAGDRKPTRSMWTIRISFGSATSAGTRL